MNRNGDGFYSGADDMKTMGSAKASTTVGGMKLLL